MSPTGLGQPDGDTDPTTRYSSNTNEIAPYPFPDDMDGSGMGAWRMCVVHTHLSDAPTTGARASRSTVRSTGGEARSRPPAPAAAQRGPKGPGQVGSGRVNSEGLTNYMSGKVTP